MEGVQCCRVISGIQKPDHEAGNGERRGVIAPRGYRQARMPQRGDLVLFKETAAEVALLVRPGDHRVANTEIGLQLDCLFKKPQRFVGFFGHRCVCKGQGA